MQTPAPQLAQTLPEDLGNNRARLVHFRHISSGIDVSSILAEIRTHRTLWLVDQRRQRNIKVHGETNSIELRRGVRPDAPAMRLEDCQESIETAHWQLFPQTTRALSGLASRERGVLARAMLVRLKPQGKVLPHIDHGTYYARRDRYHLVILSAQGSDMQCDDERIAFQQGECWCFNNKARHQAFNRSNDWRIHLIFDLLPVGRPLHFDISAGNAT